MQTTSIPVFQPLKLGILVLLALDPLTASATPCRPWQTTDAKQPLTIGTITIQTDNVFDPKQPKENRWYNRLANRLHITSKPSMLQQQLLFKTGDRLDLAKLAESERLLRTQKFLREVAIHPSEVCADNTVNIAVRTSDNWTLTPGMSVGRSGGSTKSGIEFEEHNVLGYGKSLSLSYKKEPDRNQTQLLYSDPHLLGSRHQLELFAQNNSDGKAYGLGLGLPFYALDSRTAWGFNATTLRQENSFYEQGEVLYKTGEDTDQAEVFYGWSAGQHNAQAQRYKLGWSYQRKAYFPTATQPKTPPTDQQSYPWLGYEWLQDRYVSRTNFKTMGKTEDIALGHQFSAKLGALTKSLGSDANYVKLNLNYQKGFQPSEKQLALINLQSETYVGKGQHQGSRYTVQGEWNGFKNDKNSWHALGVVHAADNLQWGEQVSIGGEDSLRGYPSGYQNGDKSALLRLEKRYYSNIYPLRIARLGATTFAEAGSAWGQGKKADWLGDVGVGLRFVSTRSSSGKVLHLNIAMPVTKKGNVDDYQILFGTQTTF